MPRLQTIGSRLTTVSTVRVNAIPSANPDSWRAGKTTSERGYGWKWQQEREQYLAEHPLCVMCDAEGRLVGATVVDHITPHRGDQKLFWRRSNWQSLCATHHSSHKQRQESECAPAV
jgi:5-methylcytosine-specific restriction endonuclease McrA